MDGTELRAIRKGLGMTQGEMAQRLGVSATFIGMMERGDKPIADRTAISARALRPKPLDRSPQTHDPMERIIEEALIEAGIPYLTDHGGQNSTRLDFELPEHDLSIEVKRFHSPRAETQIARAENVILAQGEAAVRALAAMIRAGGLSAVNRSRMVGAAMLSTRP